MSLSCWASWSHGYLLGYLESRCLADERQFNLTKVFIRNPSVTWGLPGRGVPPGHSKYMSCHRFNLDDNLQNLIITSRKIALMVWQHNSDIILPCIPGWVDGKWLVHHKKGIYIPITCKISLYLSSYIRMYNLGGTCTCHKLLSIIHISSWKIPFFITSKVNECVSDRIGEGCVNV